MLNFYDKLSPTTRLLIHGVMAIVLSAAVTGGEAAYQAFSQQGQLNPPALLVTAWSAFLLYLVPAMYAFVPSHAQQLIKAISDEKASLYDALQRAQTIRSQNIPATLQVAQPSHVVVPVAASLKSEDVSAIAAQLAMNLINIAANKATQAVASTTPAAPAQPVAPLTPAPDPYVDPLKNSAVLPAYTPPVAIPDQATQSVPAQPFTV